MIRKLIGALKRKPKAKAKRFRSSVTGRFVKADFAKANPRETTSESIEA
jgi:hypothetical protein